MANAGQQYCLRWNNHRSNLLTVFDQLLQSEAFTDVTLACEGGVSIKCHKMVLAACSAYFAALFSELPCKHPVVVLKDVKYADMKAILEYMYRGEVNVEQQQLTALIRVAETLKVKGLVEENGHHSSGCAPEDYKHHNNNTISNPKEDLVPSSAPSPPSSITTSTGLGPSSPPHSTYNKYPYKSPSSDRERERDRDRERARLPLPLWAMPGVPLATSPLQPQSSLLAAAYESGDMSPLQRKKLSSLLLHSRDTPILRTVLGQAQGSEGAAGNVPGSTASRASSGSGAGAAQGQADSSQPVSLVCHPDSHDSRPGSHSHSNGFMYDFEKVKQEGNEGSPSPYTDISMNEEELEKSRMMIPSSSPLSAADMRGVSSNIVPYVQQQKPEWKRYKQYTRNDIECAIEAVRSGMSALKAARKFGVPSRTLYDKVKKRGIVTNRPIKRASNGGNGAASGSNVSANGNGEASNGASSNGVAFPFGLSGAPVQGWMAHNMEEPENSSMPAQGLVEHWMVKAEMERDAIVAMASAQAAHALSINSASSSSPPEDRDRDRDRDRSPEARSPSPSAKPAPRYPPHLAGALGLGQLGQLGHALSALGAQVPPAARSESPPPQRERDASSPPMDVDGYQDQVEDLSVARTTSSSEEMSPPSSAAAHAAAAPHASRVIVSMQAARQEEERERERERERDLDRGLEIRGPAPIIAMDETRGSPMEVGGERD
ncbi:uncharacterized protein LOC113202800 [Frankliniella occidentalis]|uniref:Uncharacterized protein LOC113202800 n=1 Tax=Frankliniella occidentalis TaxID=133901 RepID=A0A6J1RVJ0_FRAOC|nr:uncharacterized protein LOC113202800 [Frankliniella occidentalis]